MNDQKLTPISLMVPPFPNFFTIETVKLCNSRCVFCSINEWPKHTPFMADALFDKILMEISANASHVEQVCLNGNGEPLLDKKICQRVRQCKEAGIKKVLLTTNASLLTEEISAELLHAGLNEILFSINGLDKQKHEQLRVGLNFDVVMKNALTFVACRNRINPQVQIRMRMEAHPIFTNRNITEWTLFWDKTLAKNDHVHAKKMHSWGNQIDEFKSRSILARPCQVLWSTMNILSDGKVALCCIDYVPKVELGDLNRETITEVWTAEKISNVRALHTVGMRDKIPLCRGCKIWDDDQKIVCDDSSQSGIEVCTIKKC